MHLNILCLFKYYNLYPGMLSNNTLNDGPCHCHWSHWYQLMEHSGSTQCTNACRFFISFNIIFQDDASWPMLNMNVFILRLFLGWNNISFHQILFALTSLHPWCFSLLSRLPCHTCSSHDFIQKPPPLWTVTFRHVIKRQGIFKLCPTAIRDLLWFW